MKTSILIAVSGATLLSACATNLPPFSDNDDAAPVTVKISEPNHTWQITGVVFKLEPDANGCLVPKRLRSERDGGVNRRVFKARPGDLVAIALASQYDVRTQLPCSASYAFRVEPGIKWYLMGATGTCWTGGTAYPGSDRDNGKNVNAVSFPYPVSATTSPSGAEQCVKAPL